MEYTPAQIKTALKELNIAPLRTNRVDSQQAATILTWRLKQEYDIDRPYTQTGVRRRVNTGSLSIAERVNKRFNLYDVRDVFALPLMPDRAEGAKQRISKQSENSSKLA